MSLLVFTICIFDYNNNNIHFYRDISIAIQWRFTQQLIKK